VEQVRTPLEVRAIVAAGERVGRVAESFRAAAELVGRLESLRTGIRRALVYPSVVLALGLGILVLVAVVVVPPIERTFVDLGGQLPLATRVALAASRPLRSPWSVAAAVAVLASRLLVRGGGRSVTVLDLVRFPFARRLRRDISLAVLAKLLATSLAGGLSVLESLRAAERSFPAGRVRERVGRAAASVERGGTAFDEDGIGGLLDAAEWELLSVGERSGVLASQWARVADRRTEALDARVRTIAGVAEPLLVVVVGALVGGAVLALYLPTFRVLELL